MLLISLELQGSHPPNPASGSPAAGPAAAPAHPLSFTNARLKGNGVSQTAPAQPVLSVKGVEHVQKAGRHSHRMGWLQVMPAWPEVSPPPWLLPLASLPTPKACPNKEQRLSVSPPPSRKKAWNPQPDCASGCMVLFPLFSLISFHSKNMRPGLQHSKLNPHPQYRPICAV